MHLFVTQEGFSSFFNAYTDALDSKSISGDISECYLPICCNTYWTYPNTQSLYRWKNHDFVERDCFSSDDESDFEEGQNSD